jgi:leucyl-tRNA synthetase
MDTFVDSSWYMGRFTSPHYADGPFDPDALKEWMPVDQYTGGAEHAVMHLLYARFFTKALRDMGMVDFDEPFLRLYNQGIILGEDHEKMSKSRGNVVNPDEYVGRLGADSVRCFLMFLGPWDQGGPWSTSGINGAARWLNRVWELCQHDPSVLAEGPADDTGTKDILRKLHQTIKKCYSDLDRFRFNTAIAALMELSNELGRGWNEGSVGSDTWKMCIENFLLMLAPIAPHIAEELWERAGYSYSIHNQRFPQWDEVLAAEEVITLVIQVNGRLRDKLTVPADIAEEEAKSLALASDKVQSHIDGKQVARTVYVPGRLVNVVVQ